MRSFTFVPRCVFSTTLVLVALLRAETPPPVAPATAQEEWEALLEFERTHPPALPVGLPTGETMVRISEWNRQSVERLLAFYEKYPNDPLRWDAAAAAIWRGPQAGALKSAAGPAAEAAKIPGTEIDKEVMHRNQDRMQELAAGIFKATDASPNARATAELYYLRPVLSTLAFAKAPDAAPRTLEIIESFAAHYPGDTKIAGYVTAYLGAHKDETAATLQRFADSPNIAIRDMVANRLRALEMDRQRAEVLKKPFELKFTAVDGREVDLAQLRGKVVLVDFWATWCGPCKAELPNVIANYRKYHDQGFEVIGIALEHCGFTPNDTPEQKEAKLAKAKKALTDFTAEAEIPWPQYFDGKWWKSDPAVDYFINSIPAMFLIDQNGMVVSSNARGEKLEAEVRRLLKL